MYGVCMFACASPHVHDLSIRNGIEHCLLCRSLGEGGRGVAGVQTTGKHSIATEWNLKKFTNNRFNNLKLNENAPPVNEDKFFKIISKNFNKLLLTDDRALIVFDNNLSFETSDFVNQKFDKILLVSNDNKNRQIILSEKLIEFKNALIKDQKKRLNERSINCEIISIEDLSLIHI